MTFVQTDTSRMTPAELAAYHRRVGLPQDDPASADDQTVTVAFEDNEIARVQQCSKVAGEDLATWVHDAALHQADDASDREATSR